MADRDMDRTPGSTHSKLQFRYGFTPESTLASANRAVAYRRNFIGARSETSGVESSVNSAAVLVDQNTLKKFCDEFLNQFRVNKDDILAEPYYLAQIRRNFHNQINVLHVDCNHIASQDMALYRNMVMSPSVTIQIMEKSIADKLIEIRDEALNQMGESYSPDLTFGVDFMIVRPFNLLVNQHRTIRDLDPIDIHELVAIRGIVTRVSEIVPELEQAIYRCSARPQNGAVCNNAVSVLVVDHVAPEPVRCTVCNSDGSFRLSHNESFFRNKQVVKVQEAPESIPEGETPQNILVYIMDDLLDLVRPGDRVEFTGQYMAEGQRLMPRSRVLKSTFRTYIEANNVKKAPDSARIRIDSDGNEYKVFEPAIHSIRDSNSSSGDNDTAGVFKLDEATITRLTEWRENAIREQAAGGTTICERLVKSFASSIYEHEGIKKGLLCQLLGGTEVVSNGSIMRGEINVLLCGDPGTAKSQLLQHAHKHTPRGVFTSGKGSSAVGLTAYVTRDPETNELVLESGALVLSDRGVCCIDEFDKMDDAARSILNEVMEQQTVSVAKAGVVASLHARTAILAAANPVGSRYLKELSVVDNLNLPPTLLSRFDLIFLILDIPNEARDRKLAKHLCTMYTEGGANTARLMGKGGDADGPTSANRSHEAANVTTMDTLSTKDLSAFIAYTRRTCHPTITEGAARELVKAYKIMRARGGKKTVSSTPRQLDSLVRISQALAKMEWSDRVSESHVLEGVKLMDEALQTVATNSSGVIDMALIELDAETRQRREAEDNNDDGPGAGGINNPMTNRTTIY